MSQACGVRNTAYSQRVVPSLGGCVEFIRHKILLESRRFPRKREMRQPATKVEFFIVTGEVEEIRDACVPGYDWTSALVRTRMFSLDNSSPLNLFESTLTLDCTYLAYQVVCDTLPYAWFRT
jgi:hypothetical protein